MKNLKTALQPDANKVDIGAAIAYVAQGGLVAVFALGGPRWVLVGAAVTSTAGLLARLYFNRTNKPAPAVVADAPVVPPSTQAVTQNTPALGVVKTTEP